MSTSFSGSLPLLSTLFVFYYTDFMANKICMYVCMYEYINERLQIRRARSSTKIFLFIFTQKP